MDVIAQVRSRGLTIVAIAGTAAVVAAMATVLLRWQSWGLLYEMFMLHNGPSAIVLLWAGRMVLRRQPGHGAGRVMVAIGVLDATHVVAMALLELRLDAAGIGVVDQPDLMLVPAELPLTAALLLLLLNLVWFPAVVMIITVLPLIFPDGRLPSRRWRPVAVAIVAGTAIMMLAWGIQFWPTSPWPENESPVVVEVLFVIGGLLVAIAAFACLASLVVRWRRSGPVERRQFRTVGIPLIVMVAVATVTYPWQPVWIAVTLIASVVLIVAYALAVARYRLHDLEPVLGRTAVAAVLASLVIAVYLVIVVGVGALVGRGVESTWLPLLAVGVVALLIEPARRRARRWVDQWLYGRDADRAEVLSSLATRASMAADAEEVLDDVAGLLVRSTGAARAEVWVAMEPHPHLAASAGTSDLPDPTLRSDVVHHGERLGEVRLYSWASADLAPDAAALLDDVAHSLGVVLRNARLTAQLRAQVEELRESRQRLVEVHDRTRRGMERDIHDGAQSRLIGLRLRLGLARAYVDAGDSDALVEQLDVLGDEVDAAVRSLRELARGLHPPILEQSGVTAAVRAHVRSLPIPVSVEEDGVVRYPKAVEGAVYFACLEAVQNAIRHGDATHVSVELVGDGELLRFTVRDDGTGFDPAAVAPGSGLANIEDRISALGGHVRIEAAPGAGTVVSADLPAQPVAADA